MMCRPFSLSLILLCVVAQSADAYVVLYKNNGDARTWSDTPITWRFAASGSNDVSNDEALTAITSAFDSWENIGCSTVSFNYGGLTSSYPNNGIYVAFEEDSWDVTVADAAGVTTNWSFGSFGGGVNKVDIFLNGVDFTWATSGADNPGATVSDIESVVAHEIGHAIGLDHSRERTATMWFTAYPGQAEEQQSLDADDKRAACFLYPATDFNDGLVCDACFEGSNCANGVCLNYGAEGAFCGQACSASNGCPEGFGCYQLQGVTTPQCLPDNDHCAPVGGNIGIGDFCYDHATCQSGQCLVLPDSAVCTTDCNPATGSGCPSDMECIGQGSSGICYPKGDGALGDLCVTPADCASFECVGVGSGQGICTTACATDAQCGNGVLCSFGYCIPQGSTPTGGACSLPTECEGAVCNFGKCTQECETDEECPGDGKCPNGVCTIGAQGQLGDVCGEGAEVCISGLVCLITTQGATQGVCQESCDVRTDVCSPGKLCKWFYASWSNKVSGYCVDPEGGAGIGEACGGALTCEVGLVCADTESNPKCFQDCNAQNLLGCPSGTKCASLGLESNPKLGACFPTSSGGGTTSGNTTGGTTSGTAGTDGSSQADGIPGTTDGSDGVDGLNMDGTDTTDGASSGGVSGDDDSVTNDQANDADVMISGTSSGNGCSQGEISATGSRSVHLLLLLSISLLWGIRIRE
jgi:hypothetical protein